MKRSTLTNLLIFLFALTLLSACGGGGGGGGEDSVADQNFSVKTLGGLVEGGFGAGVSINDMDQVVGLADDGLTLQAVKWDATEVSPLPTVLEGLVAGGYSAAYAVGDNEVAVGEAFDGLRPVAVYWPAGGTSPTAFPRTGLFADGANAALGINGGGEVVGEAEADALGNTVAVYWASTAAPPQILPALTASQPNFSAAYAINDFSVIVGESLDLDGNMVPVVWLPNQGGGFGQPVTLPLPTNHTGGVALAINAADVIAGESEALDGTVHGVIWEIDAAGSLVAMQDLGPETSLGAINDRQRVGGYGSAGTGSDVATLWSSGRLDDTKQLTDPFSQVYDLNDRSRVVGLSQGQGFVALPQ